MESRDVIIIGGGPAGLAAAVELYRLGVTDLLLVEREKQLGGILRQCIHDGFGLTRFHAALSGPEYAQRFIDEIWRLGIPYLTNSTVVSVSPEKVVTIAAPDGFRRLQAKAIIFAMGCRERTRGALAIPGERPCGVFTAGVAQAYMNLYNRKIGNEIVILGSGDIGMIMARRFTLEGAHVKAVFEINSIPSGLPRNIEQCIRDYHIPLYMNRTITEICGSVRVKGVKVSQVGPDLMPLAGTEEYWACDTVILSAGLIPENELSKEAGVMLDRRTRGAIVDESFQTSCPGCFAAGNVLHVHDLVDYVSQEAETVAAGVKAYLENCLKSCSIHFQTDDRICYVLPQCISGASDIILSMRVRKKLERCTLVLKQDHRVLFKKELRAAIPAEMLRFPFKHEWIRSTSNIEVGFE